MDRRSEISSLTCGTLLWAPGSCQLSSLVFSITCRILLSIFLITDPTWGWREKTIGVSRILHLCARFLLSFLPHARASKKRKIRKGKDTSRWNGHIRDWVRTVPSWVFQRYRNSNPKRENIIAALKKKRPFGRNILSFPFWIRVLLVTLVIFSPASISFSFLFIISWLGPEKITYKIHEIEPDVLFLSLIRAQSGSCFLLLSLFFLCSFLISKNPELKLKREKTREESLTPWFFINFLFLIHKSLKRRKRKLE